MDQLLRSEVALERGQSSSSTEKWSRTFQGCPSPSGLWSPAFPLLLASDHQLSYPTQDSVPRNSTIHNGLAINNQESIPRKCSQANLIEITPSVEGPLDRCKEVSTKISNYCVGALALGIPMVAFYAVGAYSALLG